MLAKSDNGFYTLNSREKYLRFTHELNPFEMISKTIIFYHFFFENRQKLKIFGIFYQNVYISKWARGRDFNDKIVIKIKIWAFRVFFSFSGNRGATLNVANRNCVPYPAGLKPEKNRFFSGLNPVQNPRIQKFLRIRPDTEKKSGIFSGIKFKFFDFYEKSGIFSGLKFKFFHFYEKSGINTGLKFSFFAQWWKLDKNPVFFPV